MRCACNRWGPGTTCERPSNTAASKEIQDKLTKMQQERSQQDKMWIIDDEKQKINVNTEVKNK
jgi:hypothetical protein